MARKTPNPVFNPADIQQFVEGLFADDLHAKRVMSLSNATVGALHAGALGVHAIGRGLATAQGLSDKHAVKQVDRLLSNCGIDVDALFASWVPHVLAERDDVVINMDWTEFAKDGHSMLVLATQTDHGRSTPLMWHTVKSSELKGQMASIEDELLLRLAELVPDHLDVTIVADRGFGDHRLYALLDTIRFDYIIRFRQGILVTDAKGTTRRAGEWVGPGGRARVLHQARVTQEAWPVPTVVCVHEKGMKDAWCIASSLPTLTAKKAQDVYGRRFTIEEMFRDIKDMRFGMGMSWQRIETPARRDRMMLITALAQGLLTLLGRAGENVGLDRMLKTNTSKKRTISLLRQGILWYQRIPNMPEERLAVLMTEFGSLMRQNQPFTKLELGK